MRPNIKEALHSISEDFGKIAKSIDGGITESH
jgi:hypothetical protein